MAIAHMCTENHVLFWEDTRQPVERGSECRATHTYTLAWIRTRACIAPLSATSSGDGPLKYPWVRESAAGRDPWDPRRVSRKRWARLLM
jgi:hypothetical protein